MRFRIGELAINEWRRSRRWYIREHGKKRADAFYDAVSIALEAIEHCKVEPLVISYVKTNAKRILLEDFPFEIVFASTEEQTVVIAIGRLTRRRGYWLSRVAKELKR
jgi:hypothetical protein